MKYKPNEYKRKAGDNSKLLIKLGNGEELTQKMYDDMSSYIIKHYGRESESPLEDLYGLAMIDKKGGVIYRAVWLDSLEDLNADSLGCFWTFDWNIRDMADRVYGWYYNERKKTETSGVYILKARTPPNNVSFPQDFWRNLEESEVLVIDPTLLKLIEIKSKFVNL